VGSGSVNPQTGAQEFASTVNDGQITDWLNRNPNASDAEIADVADSYGVTPERLAGVTGGNAAEIRRRYDAVRAQAPTTTQNPVTPGTSVGPTTTSATPVVNPGGAGLFSATGTNVTVPSAAQSTPNGPMGVTGATSQGYTANTAARAPDVVAGQGTAGSYNAAIATAAPNVVADKAVATNATTQGYQATDAQAALRPDASLWDVDDRSTVQGQVRNIVDENGPLSQRATTRATQEANRRGLANSSMAVTAGQAALYDAALPIAQQDANTFAQSGQYNAGARNERDQFNAGTQTQVNLTNAGERNQAAAFTADAANKGSMFNAENATKNSQFNVDKALQAGIVNQEQANKMAALNAEMINRASEFNITTDAQMQQFNIDAALKAGVINQEQANKMAQFNTASMNDAAKFGADAANTASQFNAAEANKLSMFQANLNADIAKFNASESNDLMALGMDSETKRGLAEIEANYKTLMQTSASGSELYKQSIASMAAILQNNDMDEAAKKTAIENLTSVLNASLAVTGQIANLDLPELDVFGQEPTPTPVPGSGLIDASGSGASGGYSYNDAGP
jgi:hypothetical protein